MLFVCVAGTLGGVVYDRIGRRGDAPIRMPWTASFVRTLPIVLFLAFVLVAGTSSSIFAAWTCE
eukprot:154747-Prymnesium_polylepis.1